MWRQNYLAVGGNLWLSAAVAAVPIILLFYLIGVKRVASWKAALIALASASVIACVLFGMPVSLAFASAAYGVAFGLFPISWIFVAAIFLYRLTVESGQFETIRASIGRLSNDSRLQVLLIAFAFGAFVEGAAGFGAPVAIAGAMLAGVGIKPFHAAALCLLANTAPVAFGSIGIPVITLAGLTGLPLDKVSASVGRISPLLSLIVPMYLTVVFAGWQGARAVMPAVVAIGIAFAGTQFVVANFVGPHLADILSSLASVAVLVMLLRFWKPALSSFTHQSEEDLAAPEQETRLEGGRAAGGTSTCEVAAPVRQQMSLWRAWLPYLLLVACVLSWGLLRKQMDTVTLNFEVPVLHNQVVRVAPVTASDSPFRAVYKFDWLTAAGTACMLAALLGGAFAGVRPRRMVSVFGATLQQLAKPILSVTAVLAFAFLMNYAGMTATMGLAFAHTGWFFPFFSAFLGWLGVFVTGSDTSANALFGNLQLVTAQTLGLNPLLTTAVNSAAGVMGKMISLQSIAIAVAATGMATSEESRLFRWTIKHSLLLTVLIGFIAMFYAHVWPSAMP